MKKIGLLVCVSLMAVFVGGCAIGAGKRTVHTPCQDGTEVYLGITPGIGSGGKCPPNRQVPVRVAPVAYAPPQYAQPYPSFPQSRQSYGQCPKCGFVGVCEHARFHNPCRSCGSHSPCEHRPPGVRGQ